MKRDSVVSSNLASVGYDASSKILEIEFKSSGVYQYLDVPKYEYEGLMSASSHGEYFAANIKNKYEFIKI
ncbi:MAG: hypothetical protein JWP12_1626 [Bacteroidetes bacterium]|nr:hypothetical protein [Bacteroidota bacterium]